MTTGAERYGLNSAVRDSRTPVRIRSVSRSAKVSCNSKRSSRGSRIFSSSFFPPSIFRLSSRTLSFSSRCLWTIAIRRFLIVRRVARASFISATWETSVTVNVSAVVFSFSAWDLKSSHTTSCFIRASGNESTISISIFLVFFVHRLQKYCFASSFYHFRLFDHNFKILDRFFLAASWLFESDCVFDCAETDFERLIKFLFRQIMHRVFFEFRKVRHFPTASPRFQLITVRKRSAT